MTAYRPMAARNKAIAPKIATNVAASRCVSPFLSTCSCTRNGAISEVRIQGMHFLCEGGPDRPRSFARAHKNDITFQKILSHRHVEECPGQLGLVLVLHVFGHADNLQPTIFNFESLPDRILPRPILRRHCFVNNRDGHRVLVIGALELAAGYNWNT